MNKLVKQALSRAVALAILGLSGGAANATVNVQCPDDTNGNGIPPTDIHGVVLDPADTDDPNVKCMHLTAGDSFVVMSDSNPLYTFGFADNTNVAEDNIVAPRRPPAVTAPCHSINH